LIVYDDVSTLEKIRVFDARVETPPHYDTFAEFQYAYHYGDVYVPYVKQEEPLRSECQHFSRMHQKWSDALTDGRNGLELVRILEASSESLRRGGAAVEFSAFSTESNSAEKNGCGLNGISGAAHARKIPIAKFNAGKRGVQIGQKSFTRARAGNFRAMSAPEQSLRQIAADVRWAKTSAFTILRIFMAAKLAMM